MSSILDALKKLEKEKEGKHRIDGVDVEALAAERDLLHRRGRTPGQPISVSSTVMVVGVMAFVTVLIAVSVVTSLIVARATAGAKVAMAPVPSPAAVPVVDPAQAAPKPEMPAESAKPLESQEAVEKKVATPPEPIKPVSALSPEKPVLYTVPPAPSPSEPAPEEEEVAPAAVAPPPTQPAKASPPATKPIEPAPVDTAPAVPAPVVPEPVAPAPPAPVVPEPVAPAPAAPVVPEPESFTRGFPEPAPQPVPEPVRLAQADLPELPDPAEDTDVTLPSQPAAVLEPSTPPPAATKQDLLPIGEVDLDTLPMLSESERVRLGLPELKINIIGLPTKRQPRPSALINFEKVYVGEYIKGTSARLIKVELRGVGIEAAGHRYFLEK